LLAARLEVWVFLARAVSPADWWPGVSGVEPDRRGAAAGGRWRVITSTEPTLFRKPAAAGRTQATVTVEGPALFAYRRTPARRAVNRLYALCQTAATI
jgi:hypothetical protein